VPLQATLSPAAAGPAYVVQVSAFRSEDEALILRNKLRNAGFIAFSEKVQAESGTLFRVRIGPEPDRDAADHLRTELLAKLGLSGMVVGYP
jgi:cell division septation protein DedD